MGTCAVNPEPIKSNLYTKESFQFIEIIGHGAFGKVWKVALKPSGKIFALKVMNKKTIIAKRSIEAVLLQKKILEELSACNSEFICNTFASFQDKEKLYLLMEYLEGSNLRMILAKQPAFSQEQISLFILSLAQGLQFLRQHNVIHRDLKPQNIVVGVQGNLKIIDFGVASYNQKDNSDYNGGTPAYMAPQVLRAFHHTFSADYYSLGVITFELFFKKRPYNATCVEQLQAMILKQEFNRTQFPQLDELSEQASDFIQKLMMRNPKKRLGYTNIQQIIDHPFLKNNTIATNSQGLKRKDSISQYVPTSLSSQAIPLELISEEHDRKILALVDYPHIQKRFSEFDSSVSSSNTHFPKKKGRGRIQSEVIS